MYYDPSGEIGIWTILLGAAVITMVLSIPSSEEQRPTEEQLKAAEEAANKAKYTVNKNTSSVEIHIQTQEILDSVPLIARNYYYQCLYNKSLEEAKEKNIPLDNLMTVEHIKWEFEMHELGYYFGFEACNQTDLNVDETLLSMIRRAAS